MGLTHNSRPSDSKCPSDELHLSLSMRVLGTRYGHGSGAWWSWPWAWSRAWERKVSCVTVQERAA